MLAPQEMETSHLFNVLKMIWNNTMPVYCQVGYVKMYDFQPNFFYTNKYLRTAIYSLAWELGKRDLAPYQVEVLDEMASCLIQYPQLLWEDRDEN